MIKELPDKIQFVTWEDILWKINEIIQAVNQMTEEHK